MYFVVGFLFFSTPSPCGHSPYILLRKTQGERVSVYLPFSSAPMLFKTTRHAAEYGRGRGVRCISPFVMLRSTRGRGEVRCIPFVDVIQNASPCYEVW